MNKIGTANIKGIDYIVLEHEGKIIYFPVIIDKDNKISDLLDKIAKEGE